MECVDHVASLESYIGEYADLVLGTRHSGFAIFRQSVEESCAAARELFFDAISESGHFLPWFFVL